MKEWTVIVSCENAQEMDELALIVRQMAEIDPGVRFVYFDTAQIFGFEDYSQPYADLFDQIAGAKPIFKQPFKRQNSVQKILTAFYNGLILNRLARKQRSSALMTGSALIFHRLARLLDPRLVHVSYTRALLAESSSATSLSDRVYFRLRKWGMGGAAGILNNYFAHKILVIGETNKRFLEERGISSDRIEIVGPIVLGRLKESMDKAEGAPGPEIVFLTQAFIHHEDGIAHAEQLAFLKDLLLAADSESIPVTVRVHPRDSVEDYEQLFEDLSIKARLDTVPWQDFLRTARPNKAVVSPASTLCFEWAYLGGEAFFYSTPHLRERFSRWYQSLGIAPIMDGRDLISAVRRNEGIQPNAVGQVLSPSSDRNNDDLAARASLASFGRLP